MRDVGEFVRLIREMHGMSQTNLAEVSGIARETLLRIEKSKQRPDLDSLMKIFKGLNIRSLSQLSALLEKFGVTNFDDLGAF